MKHPQHIKKMSGVIERQQGTKHPPERFKALENAETARKVYTVSHHVFCNEEEDMSVKITEESFAQFSGSQLELLFSVLENSILSFVQDWEAKVHKHLTCSHLFLSQLSHYGAYPFTRQSYSKISNCRRST